MRNILSTITLATALTGGAAQGAKIVQVQNSTHNAATHIIYESEPISPELLAIIEANRQAEEWARNKKILQFMGMGLLASGALALVLSKGKRSNENPLEHYRNNIPTHQQAGWDSLPDTKKYEFMSLWPNGIHGAIKQGNIGDCYLQAVLSSIRSSAVAYTIIAELFEVKETGYAVFYMGDFLNPFECTITQREINEVKKTGYDGQLGDFILSRAYYKLRNDRAKQRGFIDQDKGTMVPDQETGKMIFEGGNVAETYYNITGNYLHRQYDLDEWKEGKSIGSFSYHPQSPDYTFTPGTAHTNHAYIIHSYDSKTGIIHFQNPHNTQEILQIDKYTFLRLPGLALYYSDI